MKHTMRAILALFLFLGALPYAFAQEEAEEEAEQEEFDEAKETEKIKQIVYDYSKAYAEITKTHDKESVLKHIDSEDFVSTNVIAAVNNRMTAINGDYAFFESYLDKLIVAEGLKVKYKVKDIIHTNVRAKVASATYLVDYEFIKDKDPWSRGTETVILTFQKDKQNEWKIKHFTFVNIEDERFKGTCLCELFVAKTGNYVAKTTVPSGRTYSTQLNNFEFRKEKGKRKVIYQNRMYQWDPDNTVHTYVYIDQENTVSTGTLGTAKEPEDVVMLIIEKDLYVENCAGFKVRRRK